MAAAYPSTARDFLLAQVPDEAANVDLRGLLLAGDVELTPDEPGAAGYAVFAPAIDLVCLWGTPGPSVLDQLALRVGRGTQVVCEKDLRVLVEPRFISLVAEPLHLFALPEGARPPASDDLDTGAVRIVDRKDDVSLEHLPANLAAEMRAALARTFVAMTFVDDRPVSFCYPHHETEGFWDVSVDTLQAHRRQGHAARAFAAAHELMAVGGKAPVWGSLESNAASKGLALRLGFEPIAERYVLIAAGASGRS